MHYIIAMVSRAILRMCLIFCAFCAIPSSLSAKKKPPATPINLNTATSKELQLVPGIGPVTAEKILKMRKAYGPFKRVDDLRAIRGIGPKRLEKMRRYLTVSKPAPRRDEHSRHPSRPKKTSPESVPQKHSQHSPRQLLGR
ncbi:MAG: helix-hairpin-helix domain-containing protein [Candidatus Acidiferrum sp.]